MNRFVIIDGLPFLHKSGHVYSVRWDENGFTVGEEVKMASIPDSDHSELSIKAKCSILDSIGKPEEKPLEKMKIAELREYANRKMIDLDGAKSKDAIINIIKEQAVN